MKRALVAGMLVVATVTAQVSMAAQVKAPREVLVEYSRQYKEHLFGKNGTAKSINEATFNTVKESIIKELVVDASVKDGLRTAMSGEAGRARMESLVTLLSAQKMVPELMKADAAEANSMMAATKATIEMIANSTLRGLKPESQTLLKGAELATVRESLAKLENMSADILVRFSKAERDSYTAILVKFNNVVKENPIKAYEDLFIVAIMEAKNLDRSKAMEIVKKLKECV